MTVRAVAAVTKPMPVVVEAVGTVEAEHSVQVRAQVNGVLQSVAFKEGDKVKRSRSSRATRHSSRTPAHSRSGCSLCSGANSSPARNTTLP